MKNPGKLMRLCMYLEDHCKLCCFWGFFQVQMHNAEISYFLEALKDPLCKIYIGLTLLSHIIRCLDVLQWGAVDNEIIPCMFAEKGPYNMTMWFVVRLIVTDMSIVLFLVHVHTKFCVVIAWHDNHRITKHYLSNLDMVREEKFSGVHRCLPSP